MSIAEKFEVIADEVYEKGKKDEYDKFWDEIQNYGNRAEYMYAFSRWGSEYIRPKHKVVPTDANSGNQPFSYCRALKKVESKYFDFSQKVKGTHDQGGWYYTFASCENLEEIEDLNMPPDYRYHTTYANCKKLHTIAIVRTDTDTKYTNTFNYCYELKNLTIEGTIGQSGFSVKDCKKLSVASLLSILTALSKEQSIASGKSVTFSTVHQSVIEGDADCLEQLNLAVAAGWTIAYA